MNKKNIYLFILFLVFILIIVIIFSDKYEVKLSFQNSFFKSLSINGEKTVAQENKSNIKKTINMQTYGSQSSIVIGKDVDITYAK